LTDVVDVEANDKSSGLRTEVDAEEHISDSTFDSSEKSLPSFSFCSKDISSAVFDNVLIVL